MAGRIVAGVLLLAAGSGKLAEPAAALPALIDYASVPPAYAGILVICLALTECAAGAWILLRPGKLSLRLGLLLSVSFVGWTGYLLLLHAPVTCGCFGGLDSGAPAGWEDLFKSVGFMLLMTALVRDGRTPP